MVNKTSIQVSVPGYSETTPIFFSIQICYEQELYTIKRRYSEFVELETALEDELGDKPPIDLPGKKWIGTTNRSFLEDRRRGLEEFIRAMIKRDDFRQSLAFMKFIELSKHIKSESSKATRARGEWAQGVNEIRELLTLASKQNTGVEQRRIYLLASTKLRDLESLLVEDNSFGDGEYRRRRDLLNELNRSLDKTKNKNTFASSSGSSSPIIEQSADHIKLFGSRSSPRVLGPGAETSRTRDLNNTQLLAQQQQDTKDQDQIIEGLRVTIAKQRQLGLDINEELTYQNKILDELDDATHSTNNRLNQARRRTGKLI